MSELSPEHIRIRIEPEEGTGPSEAAGAGDDTDAPPPEPIRLYLSVKYTPGYPDEAPVLELEGAEEEVDEASRAELTEELKGVVRVSRTGCSLRLTLLAQAEESLGMAMVFTLVSHMRESLTAWVRRKAEEKERAENARREAELEVGSVRHAHPNGHLTMLLRAGRARKVSRDGSDARALPRMACQV